MRPKERHYDSSKQEKTVEALELETELNTPDEIIDCGLDSIEEAFSLGYSKMLGPFGKILSRDGFYSSKGLLFFNGRGGVILGIPTLRAH